MVGSTYSANALLHGLYERAASLDYGQLALELMAQCGKHSWCRMLEANATTTWEHWEPHDGTHSHPWATTPASAIANGLMGIRPTTPGWTTWVVKPAPGNLSTATIRVPTPHGPIDASFLRGGHGGDKAQDGASSTLSVTIPRATVASLCLPLFGARREDVELMLDDDVVDGRVDDEVDVRKGTYVCVDCVRGGQHKPPVLAVREFSGARSRQRSPTAPVG